MGGEGCSFLTMAKDQPITPMNWKQPWWTHWSGSLMFKQHNLKPMHVLDLVELVQALNLLLTVPVMQKVKVISGCTLSISRFHCADSHNWAQGRGAGYTDDVWRTLWQCVCVCACVRIALWDTLSIAVLILTRQHINLAWKKETRRCSLEMPSEMSHFYVSNSFFFSFYLSHQYCIPIL